MHVTDLDDQTSPLAASSAPPFHPRSGETSSWRLTRLAADLGNGITQQTPRCDNRGRCPWRDGVGGPLMGEPSE